MTALTASAPGSRTASLAARVRRVHWHRPEWPGVVLCAGAWLALVLRDPLPAAWVGGPHPGHGLGAQLLLHAALMSAAMMTPLALEQVRHVATFSLWRRRYRAAAVFLAAFLGAWTLAGAGLALLAAGAGRGLGGVGPVALAGALSLLAAVLPARARLVRQCAVVRPLRPSGAAADLDCLRLGLVVARRCVLVCAPLMLLATAQGGLLVMLAATGVPLLERRPGPARRRTTLDATLALVVVAVLLTWLGPAGAETAPAYPREHHAAHP